MTTERSIPKQAAENIRTGTVAAVLTVAFVVAAFSVFVAGLLLHGFRGALGDAHAKAPGETVGTIEQGLVRGPSRAEQKARAAHDELERYGFADRDAGFATIPIERAFDWMLAAQSASPPVPQATCPPAVDDASGVDAGAVEHAGAPTQAAEPAEAP